MTEPSAGPALQSASRSSIADGPAIWWTADFWEDFSSEVEKGLACVCEDERVVCGALAVAVETAAARLLALPATAGPAARLVAAAARKGAATWRRPRMAVRAIAGDILSVLSEVGDYFGGRYVAMTGSGTCWNDPGLHCTSVDRTRIPLSHARKHRFDYEDTAGKKKYTPCRSDQRRANGIRILKFLFGVFCSENSRTLPAILRAFWRSREHIFLLVALAAAAVSTPPPRRPSSHAPTQSLAQPLGREPGGALPGSC